MPHGPSRTVTRNDEPKPGDAIEGQWARDRLIKMDQAFRARIERAGVGEQSEQGDRPVPPSKATPSPREELIAHLRALDRGSR
jgi:hypothetical protein